MRESLTSPFFEFSELFTGKHEQISRGEAQSDAYHLTFGETDVMVAYLLGSPATVRKPPPDELC